MVYRCEKLGLVGLFPGMESLGGVQVSGRLAWEGIEELSGLGARERYLLCYAADGGEPSATTTMLAPVVVSSKTRAIAEALRIASPAPYILIWHIGLLKLLPFMPTKRAKVILFFHGIEAWKSQDRLTRRLLNRVNLYLSNSEYTWRRFLQSHKRYSGAAHQTVHLGLGSPVSEPLPERGGPPVALMVSRLSRSEDYKGHREVISAWPLVLARIPEAQLWIVGDGDLRPELERFVGTFGLASTVRFFGTVSEATKQQLLAECRCLALPSRGEGFGLVYLEAERLGRPCLVSTLDAGREVVNPPEAGLAVDPHDRDAIAAAICRLLADTVEWRAWSQQAVRRYESNFTARHFQERLVAALFDAPEGARRDV